MKMSCCRSGKRSCDLFCWQLKRLSVQRLARGKEDKKDHFIKEVIDEGGLKRIRLLLTPLVDILKQDQGSDPIGVKCLWECVETLCG